MVEIINGHINNTQMQVCNIWKFLIKYLRSYSYNFNKENKYGYLIKNT